MGNNIKQIREMLGISRELLASRLCASAAAIDKLERRQKVSRQIIAKLADVFHIEPEQIRDFEESKFLEYLSKKWYPGKRY